MSDKPDLGVAVLLSGMLFLAIGVTIGVHLGKATVDKEIYYDDTAHSSMVSASVGKTFDPNCVKKVIDEDQTFEIRQVWALNANNWERSKESGVQLVVDNPNLSENKTRKLWGCMVSQ